MSANSLIPRPQIYDLYWYFAAERLQMFLRRADGQPAPWTSDPILQAYKFCNVYRATDRISQYLIRDVIYKDTQASPADVLFRIVAFRFFSRSETWDSVTDYLGRQPVITDLADGSLAAAVEHALATNGKLYTGAFILCANQAYGYARKHLNHLALWQDMFIINGLAEQLLAAPSLRAVYDLLRTYPLMGDFMSYQIAIDLNYSPYINFSENDFTKAGPGARRGITKAFASTGNHSAEDIIMYMVERQDKEFARLGLEFPGLHGRPLQAIDAQGLFCELDKYCREAAPGLASNRSRIKARYGEPGKTLPLFLPPKWRG
jgi:hypothetical protein